MTSILIAPILVFLFAAAMGMLLPGKKPIQFFLTALASVSAIIFSSMIITHVIRRATMVMALGEWRPPFGIILVADHLSAVMLLASNIVGLGCIIYSYFEVDDNRVRHGFYSMLSALLAGANGIFLTGDLFNLYVWFEVLLISSFCLLTIGNQRKQLKGSLPYVFINLFASTLLLVGVGAIYGMTGTLNMAEISLRLKDVESSRTVLSVTILLLLTLGIKAAVVPLFFWLPVAYHTPLTSVTAIFAALLTKAAVYSMLRISTLFFPTQILWLQEIILIIAGLTMLTGVLGAAGQGDFKRILSFHIISQIGYMIMGLAFFSAYALAGTSLFIVHNIFVKSTLFLISGIAQKVRGSSLLKRQGGLYRSHLPLAIVFLMSAFSLTGLPPLSGFWGKLLLTQAGLRIEQYLLVGISLLVSVLTLFSMTKIWLYSFWKTHNEIDAPVVLEPKVLLWVVYALSLISFTPVLWAGPILEYFIAVGEELMQPQLYIEAVRSWGGQR